MNIDWKNKVRKLLGAMGTLRRDMPEVANSFTGLAAAATAEGALSTAHKELMATAIGISIRCEACIAFHTKQAAKHGATREELIETIGMATYMGGGPAYTYGALALEAWDQFTES